ncbi:LIRP-like [Rhynchophorus ferrugineus]|uniref:LIRP-like n=1 Tax=Rhynchophorus ferrugineus TaxID=354439 RepID=UPI003FCE216D
MDFKTVWVALYLVFLAYVHCMSRVTLPHPDALVRYCGDRFPDISSLVCQDMYHHADKKSKYRHPKNIYLDYIYENYPTEEQRYPFPFVMRSNANKLLRMKRDTNPTIECCLKPCKLKEIQTYCEEPDPASQSSSKST